MTMEWKLGIILLMLFDIIYKRKEVGQKSSCGRRYGLCTQKEFHLGTAVFTELALHSSCCFLCCSLLSDSQRVRKFGVNMLNNLIITESSKPKYLYLCSYSAFTFILHRLIYGKSKVTNRITHPFPAIFCRVHPQRPAYMASSLRQQKHYVT